MKTQILAPESENFELAISFLKKGVPIAFPTETVYGLGAPIFIAGAIEQIFAIKGRPSDNPLIVHIASLEEAHLLSEDLPDAFFLLARHFWPGPLTFVVKRKNTVPGIVSAGLPTIAIRMPSHPVARRLIEGVGPLAAPSANISGRPSPTTSQDVLEDLNGKIPLIIDGICSVGIESTVVSLLDDVPIILRPGSIAKEAIEVVLGQKIEKASCKTLMSSPGMKYRHYAPKAKMRLVFEKEKLRGPYTLSPMPSKGTRLLDAATLYSELRIADRSGIAEIEIDCSERNKIDPGLMDRLLRASGIDLSN